MANWYELNKTDQIASPAILIHKQRVEQNISFLIKMVGGDASRLVPHVKTHKMKEVVQLQLNAGITKFKCSTISEAEMIAQAGGKWVLIAYQLVGPNLDRLFEMASHYSDVQFGVLVDNQAVAKHINDRCKGKKISILIFIDVNSGMNRTGHPINSNLLFLYDYISKLPNLLLAGIHVYDGHIRDQFFKDRKSRSDIEFEQLTPLFQHIEQNGLPNPIVIAGGTPTFTVHSRRPNVLCSPGTFIFMDFGYSDRFKEQPFVHAAVVMTRIISKPAKGLITIDLGHKAIAPENPIDQRIRFLNLKDYTLVGQSEEHCVLEVKNWDDLYIGDVLYGIPFHVCPSISMYDYVNVVENSEVTTQWKVDSRTRQINF